jgi:hypothetical protein
VYSLRKTRIIEASQTIDAIKSRDDYRSTGGAMPERRRGEPLNKFVSRFVSSKREEKQFKNKKQRLAVAYSEARRGSKHA